MLQAVNNISENAMSYHGTIIRAGITCKKNYPSPGKIENLKNWCGPNARGIC